MFRHLNGSTILGAGFGVTGRVARADGGPPVIQPPPNPEEIGAIYWWDAAENWTDNGTNVAWTDLVAGVTLTNNATTSPAVNFGKPIRVINEDHDGRPATLHRVGGALQGPVTPMASGRRLSIFIAARAGNDEYRRVAGFVSATLQNSTGTFTLNTRTSTIYGSSGYRNFDGGPPLTNQDVVLYEWSMGPLRQLSDMESRADNVPLTPGAGTSPTTVLDSTFGRIVVGATTNFSSALVYTYAEVEQLIVMDVVTPEKRQQIIDWWTWRKMQSQPMPAEKKVVLQYGQSNAVGQDTSAETVFARHGNTCFGNYLLSWYADNVSSPSDRANPQSLKERNFESGMAFGLDLLVDMKLAALGSRDWRDLGFSYFAINPAVSGRSIEQLSTGTDWARVPVDLAGAKAICGDEGTLDWVWWTHGFSNAGDARGAYAPKLVSMFNNIKAAAVAAGFTGADPNFVIAQHCTSRTNATFPSVGLSQLEVADADPKAHIFPLYPMNWKNGTHMSTIGQKTKGAMYARVMADIDAGTYVPVRTQLVSWTPLDIVLEIVGGNGTYAFDTTAIAAAPNNGFDVWASDSVTLQNIISGVSMVGNLITISLSAPASAGSRLGYGWGRAGMTTPVNLPYALGNLRDTDPRTATINGQTIALRNWCLVHEVNMPA